MIREAREHAEEQRAGEAVIYPKSGRMEEELSLSSSSEEEEKETGRKEGQRRRMRRQGP